MHQKQNIINKICNITKNNNIEFYSMDTSKDITDCSWILSIVEQEIPKKLFGADFRSTYFAVLLVSFALSAIWQQSYIILIIYVFFYYQIASSKKRKITSEVRATLFHNEFDQKINYLLLSLEKQRNLIENEYIFIRDYLEEKYNITFDVYLSIYRSYQIDVRFLRDRLYNAQRIKQDMKRE